MNLKDSSALTAKKENWQVVENELRKFSIRLNKEQITAIVNSLRPTLLKELLERLMEVDQKVQNPHAKKPLKPWQADSTSEQIQKKWLGKQPYLDKGEDRPANLS